MKSLILKDLYNISHNSKTMILILIIMGAFFIPMSGPVSYVAITTMICSMMVVTTFSFDDTVKWNRYALVMPVTRKDIVISKYIGLLLFSLCGLVIGIIGSFGAEVFTHNIIVIETLLSGIASLGIALIFGSIIIPLLFRYGAEKARMLMILCFLIPAGIGYVIMNIAQRFNLSLSDTGLLSNLLWFVPLIIIAFVLISVKISTRIFGKVELN